ncbi:MAG: type II secretion system F family protein [Methylobacteriaceae bacterium]|nr:type II secretion system F family protein [Methylobacteriaceae bacterium]
MDWFFAPLLETLSHPALLQAFGVALALAGVAAVFYLKGRSQRAARKRLLKGTPRDRIAGGGAITAARKGQQIDALVVSLGARALARDPTNSKSLRTRLRRAGYFSKSTFAYFIALRVVTTFVVAGGFYLGALAIGHPALDPLVATMSGLAFGYVAPGLFLNRRINRFQTEHRNGFPDVMDLMVVCVQAGLSLEAGIQKIGEELAHGYPSLSRHLELTSLELRNGKSLSQAIEALADRLGIDEASSFATLLHQSEQLGASISDSLRAFSDDMRNKRLMRAEEKAYALPTKLVIPLTLFVFPVLLVVLLLPVAIAVSTASA